MCNLNRQSGLGAGSVEQFRGYSLLELLISVTIGALLIIGVVSVFLAQSKAATFSEQISQLQANGQFALTRLQRDLQSVGGIGLTYNKSTIRPTAVSGMIPKLTGNCFTTATSNSDWALGSLAQSSGDPSAAIYGLDGSSAASLFGPCLDGVSLEEESDIISTHYIAAEEFTPSTLVAGGVYVHSGLGGGVIFQCAVAGDSCFTSLTDRRTDVTGTKIYKLVTHLYYVRTWNSNEDDDIPTLMRVAVDSDGSINHESLVAGVSTLQILYGFDSDEDGNVDQYRKADQLDSFSTSIGLSGDWMRIKSVRVSLLVETAQFQNNGLSDRAPINVEGHDIELRAGHIARLFSTTTAIRNPGRAGDV
ncbi:MAG: type IV pilus assembly protein PilW [Granulosicoccus sp.]|jgi:type IV pilus assembly protein PilW